MFFLDWMGIDLKQNLSYFSFYIAKGLIAYITLYLLMLVTEGHIEILTTKFNNNNDDGSPTQILKPETQIIETKYYIKELAK